MNSNDAYFLKISLVKFLNTNYFLIENSQYAIVKKNHLEDNTMAANSNNTRMFQATMHQLVAMMRDPAFHNALSLEYLSEMPSGTSMWYHFHHNMSFTSWGEKIIIGLMPLPGGLVSVEVSSECAMPTQIIDWGKNKKNIEGILNYISVNLLRYQFIPTPAAAGTKFCPKCGNRLDASILFCSACGTKQV